MDIKQSSYPADEMCYFYEFDLFVIVGNFFCVYKNKEQLWQNSYSAQYTERKRKEHTQKTHAIQSNEECEKNAKYSDFARWNMF